MIGRMCERMLEDFYQLRDEWVIIKGKPLRLCTRQMWPIPKAWASFIVQTLESASKQYEFFMKKCQDLMEIQYYEPIDVGLLIVENFKYMVDTPQGACGNFCFINELCKLSRVPSHLDDVMVSPMLAIHGSVIRSIPTHPINEDIQDKPQQKEQDKFYHPEIHQLEGAPQQQHLTHDRLQRLEEYVLGMTSWANEISPDFYVEPARFELSYHAFYDEHRYHMSVPNLRECFATTKDKKSYFRE